MSGFADAVVGGDGTLIRKAIKSPDYVAGTAGWSINKDGSAEFNNLAIRGTFNGTDYELNSNGAFFYSASAGAGKLATSTATADGTDQYGNHYLSGDVSYSSDSATQTDSGTVTFYTGTQAGGWTAQAQIFISGAVIVLDTSGGVITANNTLDDGSGGATFNGSVTVTGSLSVNGSTSTGTPDNNNTTSNGLSSPGIVGTSGAASTGTAHTHGPGTFTVGSGQHVHQLNNHHHPL